MKKTTAFSRKTITKSIGVNKLSLIELIGNIVIGSVSMFAFIAFIWLIIDTLRGEKKE